VSSRAAPPQVCQRLEKLYTLDDDAVVSNIAT
jgi:hypothetical protein